jgi:hypothetical protein
MEVLGKTSIKGLSQIIESRGILAGVKIKEVGQENIQQKNRYISTTEVLKLCV